MEKEPSSFDVAVLGGGGHAKVLVDALTQVHPSWSIAVLDPHPELLGTVLVGAPVVGDDGALAGLLKANPELRFAVGVGAVRSTALRQRLFEMALAAGAHPLTIIHPSACVSRWAAIEAGVQVLAGAIVNAGAEVQANALVNTGAIVEHDCVVERHAHVATGARLAGGVVVGAGAMVGAGAVVRQGQRIGPGAMVGAGAAVVSDVGAGETVAGVPARPLAERRARAR